MRKHGPFFFEGEKVKKIKKRYPMLAAIILLFAGYFGWYENDHSQDNLFGQAGQVTQAIQSSQASQSAKSTLTFRSDSLCEEHFEKHGIEMGWALHQLKNMKRLQLPLYLTAEHSIS